MPHYIEPKKPKVGGTGPMGTVRESVKRVILTPGPGAKNAVGLLCSKKMVFLQESAKKHPHKRMAEHVWTSR